MLIDNKVPAGTRVYALLSTSEDAINYLGEGVYEGDFLRPDAPTFDEVWNDPTIARPADLTREKAQALYQTNPFFHNPRIRLDNGDIVWGYECYWGQGGIDDLKRRFPGRQVVQWRIARDDKGVAVAAQPLTPPADNSNAPAEAVA